MLVRLQSAVSIEGMMAESGLKQLLAKESKYLIRLPQVQILLIPPIYAQSQMPENGALPNAGIGVSLQNSFSTRSIRVGTSNNVSDSSK